MAIVVDSDLPPLLSLDPFLKRTEKLLGYTGLPLLEKNKESGNESP